VTDNWVGFARSPKSSVTASLESFDFEIASELGLANSIQLISTAAGVASWVGDLTTPTNKWRFVPGAKLVFCDESGAYGATFGAVSLPTEVVLLTERFGEIQLGFREGATSKKSGLAWFRGKRPNIESEPTPASEASGTKIQVKVSRMCEPGEVAAWELSVEGLIARLGVAAHQRSNSVRYTDE